MRGKGRERGRKGWEFNRSRRRDEQEGKEVHEMEECGRKRGVRRKRGFNFEGGAPPSSLITDLVTRPSVGLPAS